MVALTLFDRLILQVDFPSNAQLLFASIQGERCCFHILQGGEQAAYFLLSSRAVLPFLQHILGDERFLIVVQNAPQHLQVGFHGRIHFGHARVRFLHQIGQFQCKPFAAGKNELIAKEDRGGSGVEMRGRIDTSRFVFRG